MTSAKLRLELQAVEARAPEDLEGAFAAIGRERVRGVVVLTDATFIGQRRQTADLATKSRVPTVFARRENVEGGALMSYGPNLSNQSHHAATYVGKILKGADSAGAVPLAAEGRPKRVGSLARRFRYNRPAAMQGTWVPLAGDLSVLRSVPEFQGRQVGKENI